MKLALEWIAAALASPARMPGEATGYSVDSRSIQSGELFIALRGPTISRFGRGYAAPWDMTPVLSSRPSGRPPLRGLDKSGDISHHTPYPKGRCDLGSGYAALFDDREAAREALRSFGYAGGQA